MSINNIDEQEKLLEKLSDLLSQFTDGAGTQGAQLIEKLYQEYGNEIGDRIFDIIDIDNDGSISDTIPDILEKVGDFFSGIFS